MRKKIAAAATVAILAFPLCTTLTLADTASQTASTTNSADLTTTTTPTSSTTTPVVDSNGNTVVPENWFTYLIEKIELALTFDPARKCELTEHQALAKLAETQKLMQEENNQEALNSLTEYSDKVANAQSFLEQVKDPTSATAVDLARALVNVNSNNIKVLSNLLDKLPPQAAQKLALNIERSMEKAVMKIQKEDANPASATTPTISATNSVTASGTPIANEKNLEKQAEAALKKFKESLSQKGKIHFEDQDQQDNDDNNAVEQSKPEQEESETEQSSTTVTQSPATPAQSIPQGAPSHVTVAPINPQTGTTARISEDGNEDQNKQKNHENDQHGDKYENHNDHDD